MEITRKSQQTSDDIFTVKQNSSSWGLIFRRSGDPTNCKLSYFHGLGALKSFEHKDKKKVIDEMLKGAKGHVIINTTSEEVAKFINENYTVYYYNITPVGYSLSSDQHHICIRNDIRKNEYCRIPKKSSVITKEKLKEALNKKLKSLRRKSDYVDDFVNEIFK